mmetsp:Transcript_10778/g.19525  ORF Transcript_10778/g.19525 Transcript_10778/m.19525 type:complete len:118 (+) Transcript_10778:336-689(+)
MDSLIFTMKPPLESWFSFQSRMCMAATFVSSLRRPKTTLNLILAEDSRLAACTVAVLFGSNARSSSDAQRLKGSRLRGSHVKLHPFSISTRMALTRLTFRYKNGFVKNELCRVMLPC